MIKWLQNIIDRQAQLLANEQIAEYKQNQRMIKSFCYKSEFPIGSKVIVRSNEWDNLVVGEVISHDASHGNIIAVVHDYISNQDVFCFGIIRLYSKDLLNTLLKLNPDEQWLILSRTCTNLHNKRDNNIHLKGIDEYNEILNKVID